jgi:hypothetical protein
MWGKKKVYEHQDFPVYVGELPVGTEVTEMKWWYKGGMNQAEMLNELVTDLKAEGFDAIVNYRCSGGDVMSSYGNAVKIKK